MAYKMAYLIVHLTPMHFLHFELPKYWQKLQYQTIYDIFMFFTILAVTAMNYLRPQNGKQI